MELLIVSYLFVLGAAMGSFTGAMVWRIKTGRKLANDRSECEHCHHKLSWLDLVPLISWLWLRGRCRYCHKPIGWAPLILELTLGVIFALSYLFWPFQPFTIASSLMFASWLLALTMLAILFVYDLRWFLLPDKVIWPLTAVGVVIFILRALLGDWSLSQAFVELGVGMLPVTGIYYTLYSISKGSWIGFGDVKLGLFIGLALGWQGALAVLLLSNLLGTLWIVPGVLLGRITRRSRIPFGPFLIAATVMVMLWQSQLVGWYVNFLYL